MRDQIEEYKRSKRNQLWPLVSEHLLEIRKGRIAMSEGRSSQLVTVGLLFSTICLPVAAREHETAEAKIPFSFFVGRVRFPAGDYQVRQVAGNRDELLIRSAGGKVNFLFPTEPIRASKPKQFGYLVFRSTGDGHFLSQIWKRGRPIGRRIPAALIEDRQGAEDACESEGKKGWPRG